MPPSLAERVAAVEVKADNNETTIQQMGERLNRLFFWLLATFGGVTTAVFLLVLQLSLAAK